MTTSANKVYFIHLGVGAFFLINQIPQQHEVLAK